MSELRDVREGVKWVKHLEDADKSFFHTMFFVALHDLLTKHGVNSRAITIEEMLASVLTEVRAIGVILYPQAAVIRQAFRELEAKGIGWLCAGRHGFKTRFIFFEGEPGKLVEILEAVAAEHRPRPNPSIGAERRDGLTHRYVLRDGAFVVELPIDLKQMEAARLTKWIESLPSDGA